MKFNKIDMDIWNRKQHFEHYLKNVKCGFSITSNIEFTALVPAVKAKSLKLYPVLLYMVTTVANMQQELRTCFNDHQELGYWEAMNPSYTVFHQDTIPFRVFGRNIRMILMSFIKTSRLIWRSTLITKIFFRNRTAHRIASPSLAFPGRALLALT